MKGSGNVELRARAERYSVRIEEEEMRMAARCRQQFEQPIDIGGEGAAYACHHVLQRRCSGCEQHSVIAIHIEALEAVEKIGACNLARIFAHYVDVAPYRVCRRIGGIAPDVERIVEPA